MGMVVNFFFSGFVLGKVPFALSPRFKLMLQVRLWLGGKGCRGHGLCDLAVGEGTDDA